MMIIRLTISTILALVFLIAAPWEADAQRRRTPNLNLPLTGSGEINTALQKIDDEVNRLKTQRMLNIRDYGALCDSTTDDSAAIQAAENVADDTGGTVLIPTGTCVIDDSIEISSGVTIAGQGWGSILQGSSNLSSEPHLQSEADPATDAARDTDITIRDLVIDGQNSSASSMGIQLRSTVDTVVSNVLITDTTSDCVYISSGTTTTVYPLRNTIQGVHCVNSGRSGLVLISGIQTIFNNNQIDSPTRHGINVELTTTASFKADGVSITGNVIEDTDATTSTCGISLGGDTSGQEINNVSVTGNTINDPGNGICFRHTTNLNVSGNVINSASNDGIVGVSGSDAPVNTTISNNVVTGSAQYGLNWTRTTPISFTGNFIKSTTAHAIRLVNTTGTLISGNMVDTVAGSQECIALSDTTDVVITGNELYNCPDDGINISGAVSVDGTVIVGNVIEANGNCIESTNAGGATPDYTTVKANRFVTCTTPVLMTGLNSVFEGPGPDTQTIAGGNTVTADACSGFKAIDSSGSVTTSTSNTFTTPSAANRGCIMNVCNVGSQNITLDLNANFLARGAGDLVLGANDCVVVGSNGTTWYQVGYESAN